MSQLTDRGREIYNDLYPVLIANEGDYVAIEITTGDFFVADSLDKAVLMARSKYPDKEFYCTQIGKETVFSFANRVTGVR